MTTTEAPEKREWNFVGGLLPWLVAAGATVFFLATLNPWVRVSSLPLVSRTAGWDWQPNLYGPVLYLATLPFRSMPEAWLPVALNAFTAVCAALVLALLARSVTLLPHDRLPIERELECSEHSLLSIPAAWIPPLLAVFACGLQLSFWENATVASGVMLDLLLFAYAIRCLLEFRIDQRQSWMNRAALVVGLGMANDWAMIAFLPLFLLALLWIKGLRFFAADFLLRVFLFGLAGVSLILLPPLMAALSADSALGFWPAVKQAVGGQLSVIWYFLTLFYRAHRAVALLLAVVGLLPILAMSLRWHSITADNNPIGMFVSKAVFYTAYLALLLLVVVVAFDPPFSPRSVGGRVGFWFPCLTLYYLAALAVGYFSGFFLLVLTGTDPRHTWRHNEFPPAVRFASSGFLGLVLVLLPAALLLKNLPFIRAFNLPILGDYARLSLQSLPPEGAVVVSDDPGRLLVLRATLAKQGGAGKYLLLDSTALSYAAYRASLHHQYSKLWPEKPSGVRTNPPLDQTTLLLQLDALSKSNRIFYLHPSFGYYFERFCPKPHGLVDELLSYPVNTVSAPNLTVAEVEANEAFWSQSAAGPVRQVLSLSSNAPKTKAGLRAQLLRRLKCKPETPVDALVAANWYSIAADAWGARLQRSGKLREAARSFELAKELFPNNRAAALNLECNQQLTEGRKMTVDPTRTADRQLGAYRDIGQLLKSNGPVDDPNLCFALGMVFTRGQLYRQAAQQFERVQTLAPGSLTSRLMLGGLFSFWRMPDSTLEVVAAIRAAPDLQPLSQTEKIDVDFLEAAAWFAKTNDAKAHRLVEAALASKPDDAALLSRVTALFISHQRYTNALATLDRQLRLQPDDVVVWNTKGYLYLQMGVFSNAVAALNQSLTLKTNNPEARLNRAIAYLRNGDLDAAQSDYLTLLQSYPTAFRLYYGLAEIAYQKKDTNAAIRYCEGYLSNSAPNLPETQFVRTRLKELRPGRR